MPAFVREVGSTNVYIGVFIPDATVSTGAGLANVSSATVSLSWWRNNMSTVSTQTLTTGTLGTWSASSMVQMNSTLALGHYGIALPNGMFASGDNCIAHIYGGANMAPVPINFDLTTHAVQNVVNPVGVSTVNTSVNASTVSGLVGVSTVTTPVTASSVTAGVNASTVSDKAGYGVSSLSAGVNVTTFSALVGVSTITVGVNASTVSDKVGYGVSSISVGVNASSVTDKAGYGVSSFTAAAAAAMADKILGRNVSSGADGGRTVSEALYVLRNKVDAGAGVVYMTDDTTSSWGFSVSTMAGLPIVAIDPA